MSAAGTKRMISRLAGVCARAMEGAARAAVAVRKWRRCIGVFSAFRQAKCGRTSVASNSSVSASFLSALEMKT